MTTTTKEAAAQAELLTRWQQAGLAESVQADLIAIARELAETTGVPLTEALGEIDTEVTVVLRARLISRVRDTITYGSDLDK